MVSTLRLVNYRWFLFQSFRLLLGDWSCPEVSKTRQEFSFARMLKHLFPLFPVIHEATHTPDHMDGVITQSRKIHAGFAFLTVGKYLFISLKTINTLRFKEQSLYKTKTIWLLLWRGGNLYDSWGIILPFTLRHIKWVLFTVFTFRSP